MKVVNPPAGLTVRPGTVAEGQAVGVFTVSAASDANFGVAQLDVVAESVGSGPLSEKAGKTTVFAVQATLPTNTLTEVGLAAALATAQGVALDTPPEPIEVAHGFGAPVAVKVVRGKDAFGALTLSALPCPPD